MSRSRQVILGCLGLFVLSVWSILIFSLFPALTPRSSPSINAAVIEFEESPTLTPFIPSPTPLPTSTLVPRLPALYVDGAFVRRSDTRQSIWLKGVNIEEFRQSNPHTLIDLLNVQGLNRVIQQKWDINLLRIAIDPETVEANLYELSKTITFAQENGMYVILVPFASAINPARDDEVLPVPDDLVASAMSYLADHFKNRTNVLYGIWNEPHPDSIQSFNYDKQWQIWMATGIEVAKSIRSKNPTAILVVPGGDKWARDMSYYQAHPFPFDNVIYDVHDYWAYPAYQYSRLMWTWAIGKYPILIGEFGGDPTNPSDKASIAYTQETYRIIDQNPGLIHYAVYALTNDGVWGIFTHDLATMPKGNLLYDDLIGFPPTLFRK